MTALVIPSAQILAEMARTDPEVAVRIYGHRAIVGTLYGRRWHIRGGEEVCNACRLAYNAHQRTSRRREPVGTHYPERRLRALASDPAATEARAETLAFYGHPLSTPVHTAVHSATDEAA